MHESHPHCEHLYAGQVLDMYLFLRSMRIAAAMRDAVWLHLLLCLMEGCHHEAAAAGS